MPLDFEVVPESALRNDSINFVLGMPVRQAIAWIQKMCNQIKGVELLYCQQDPLSRDLVINLSNDGIRLIFDSKSQTLKRIEVYDFGNLNLRYYSTSFSSPHDQATVAKVEQCFGATHPGVYDASQQVYVLNWRGLSFSFPTESVVEPHYAHGLGSLQIAEGSSPFVSKMCIFQGPSLSDAKVPSIPQTCLNGNCCLESLEALQDGSNVFGVKLNIQYEVLRGSRLPDSQLKEQEAVLCFGDSVQKVMSEIGCPTRVFYKSEDKMKIHRPTSERQRDERHVDYFYNYFTLGLDILFDAETHAVKKFVLHTNFPGHYDFGIYDRCNFKIDLKGLSRGEVSNENPLDRPFSLRTFTRWEDVQEEVWDGKSQTGSPHPVVLNRSSSGNGDNPFGSTLCYGYRNMILEVMRNGYLASLTFFEPPE